MMMTTCNLPWQAEKRQEEQAKRSKYSKPREIKPPARVGAEAIRPKRILRPELNKSKQEKKEKPLTEEELAAKAAKEKAIARNRKIAGLYHKRVTCSSTSIFKV